MQSWTKRGIQTALVTGGLLMLGTGIASAQENVSPDTPPGPLNVNIPIETGGNALGTPLGQFDLPPAQHQLGTDSIAEKVAPLAKVAKAPELPRGLADSVQKVPTQLDGSDAARQLDLAPADDLTTQAVKGNKVDGDVTVPIEICGNAVAAGGDVSSAHACEQVWDNSEDVQTDGTDSGAAGNTLVLDWAQPVQVAGNAVGGFGTARTSGSAKQVTTETTDVTTDGSGSGLAGNVGAVHGATPVQVTGNAVSGLTGNADSSFDAKTAANSGGYVVSDGTRGAGSGNVLAGPVAAPLKVNGNAVTGGLSTAQADSVSSADATAGGTTPGLNNIPSYVQTGGADGTVAGNVMQPQGAIVGSGATNAISGLGNAASGNTVPLGRTSRTGGGVTASQATAGGFTSTTGRDGVVAGNLVDAPAAAAGELYCDAGGVAGNANANCVENTTATAGGGTYTDGTKGVLSGNAASVPPAAMAENYATGAGGLGDADVATSADRNVKAGGYTGTQGDDSVVSGNLVQTPLSAPVEGFGAAGGFGGSGTSSAYEAKRVQSGGGGNTKDDGGVGSSNLIATPASLPEQAFGIAASGAGSGKATADTDTESTAGGDYHATGAKGVLSGNLAQVPVSQPDQLHGIGASGAGTADATANSTVDSAAGGGSNASGSGGTLAGNIVQAPAGGAGSANGIAGGAADLTNGNATHEAFSTAGGDAVTSGASGTGSGNVLSSQSAPIAQNFGASASGLGNTDASSDSVTDLSSGGAISSSGADGALAGNVLDVPTAPGEQVFAEPAAALANSFAHGDNVTDKQAGGQVTTDGDQLLSGFALQPGLDATPQVYNMPREIAGHAISTGANNTTSQVGGDDTVSPLDTALGGQELRVTELPALPTLPNLRSAEAPEIPALAQLTELLSLDELTTLTEGVVPEGIVPESVVSEDVVSEGIVPEDVVSEGTLTESRQLDALGGIGALGGLNGLTGLLAPVTGLLGKSTVPLTESRQLDALGGVGALGGLNGLTGLLGPVTGLLGKSTGELNGSRQLDALGGIGALGGLNGLTGLLGPVTGLLGKSTVPLTESRQLDALGGIGALGGLNGLTGLLGPVTGLLGNATQVRDDEPADLPFTGTLPIGQLDELPLIDDLSEVLPTLDEAADQLPVDLGHEVEVPQDQLLNAVSPVRTGQLSMPLSVFGGK